MSLQSAIDSLDAPVPSDRLKPVRIWLYLLAATILVMVMVGGLTRLTGSGLSITSWKPISGILPPLSAADWQAEFDGYKQIPEYALQNSWMSLDDFKSIFWWEWAHRFLGRMIGFLFAIPFLWFLFERRLPKSLAPSLAVLFVLGGFQGFLGWWMVSSGLSGRVDVSQYRLAAHLGAATILFLAIIFVARTITPSPGQAPTSRGWFAAICALLVLIFLQLEMGAFVAGLDAGFGYNTWPLMEGQWIPDGLWQLSPAWHNIFEQTLTAQFVHRCIAYLIAAFALVLLWAGWRGSRFAGQHRVMLAIGALILVQIVLGISTLLLVVPIPLAIAHQATAFLLLGTVIAYIADMRPTLA